MYNCTVVFTDDSKNQNCKLSMEQVGNLRECDIVMNVVIKGKIQ